MSPLMDSAILHQKEEGADIDFPQDVFYEKSPFVIHFNVATELS